MSGQWTVEANPGNAEHSLDRASDKPRTWGSKTGWPSWCSALPGLALLLLLSGCKQEKEEELPWPEGDGTLRIVSTAPNLTEIVFAIGAGDLLVGRTDVCDYPPDVTNVAVVGEFAIPRLEPLIAVNPTHVLESSLVDASLKATLAKQNIKLVHVICARLDDIPTAFLQIGYITDHLQLASVIAKNISEDIEGARAADIAHTNRPRVFLLFAPDAPTTAGGDTFVSELLTLAGGDNIAAESTGYFHASLEWVLTCDPDIILCLFDTQGKDPAALFAEHTGWRSLRAVREGRIKTVDKLDTVLRPGPRVLEGLKRLKQVIGFSRRDRSDAEA